MGLIKTTDMSIEESLESIRAAVQRQLGVGRPSPLDIDPDAVIRFSDNLPAVLSPEERQRLVARAADLDPWLQGPFHLGGDLVIGGTWRCDLRWAILGAGLPERLSGKRVLDVGTNAGYDAFMFARRGADHVVACEPFGFYHQALFLESIYKTGVEFQNIGWQELGPQHGSFDVVHCNGVLYHEPNPIGMLLHLRSLIAPGGELVLGSMMLFEPEQSEYLRFVPGSYFGDDTWWFVPGRLALRWMLEVTGFRVVDAFTEMAGPPGEFPVVTGYLRATGMDPVPHLAPPVVR